MVAWRAQGNTRAYIIFSFIGYIDFAISAHKQRFEELKRKAMHEQELARDKRQKLQAAIAKAKEQEIEEEEDSEASGDDFDDDFLDWRKKKF